MKVLALLSVLVLMTSPIGSTYAHKEQIVGDYKIDGGWTTEPPIAGKKNGIEIVITKATSSEKKNPEITAKMMNMTAEEHAKMAKSDSKMKNMDHSKMKKTSAKIKNGVTGLKDLQVDITIAGQKSFVKTTEDKKNPGRYVGEFTPKKDGYPTLHIYAKIKGSDVETTFHPEKVETPTTKSK